MGLFQGLWPGRRKPLGIARLTKLSATLLLPHPNVRFRAAVISYLNGAFSHVA